MKTKPKQLEEVLYELLVNMENIDLIDILKDEKYNDKIKAIATQILIERGFKNLIFI